MGKLYRRAPVQSPSFGRNTFWVYPGQRDRLKCLAKVEAGTPILPPHRDYVVDVSVPEPLPALPVDALLAIFRGMRAGDGLPPLRDGLLKLANERATPGVEWVQLREYGVPGLEETRAPWALVYVGDEPLPARPSRD